MNRKEQQESNEKRGALLQELRRVIDARKARTPGQPSIAIPLDQIYSFKTEGGDDRAVIPIAQVLYLAEEILREG